MCRFSDINPNVVPNLGFDGRPMGLTLPITADFPASHRADGRYGGLRPRNIESVLHYAAGNLRAGRHPHASARVPSVAAWIAYSGLAAL